MWSHQLGWELRLMLNHALQQSRVCRAQDEVLDPLDWWNER
jgi:hypothetical protein